MRMICRFLLVFLAAHSFGPLTAAIPEPKLGPVLNRQLQQQKSKTYPIMVYLKAKADLTAAENKPSRVSRIKYVYDQLRNTALTSQTDIVRLLTKSKVKFQRFYISNTIAIENATPALIKVLAARSDIERIIGNPTVTIVRPLSNPAEERSHVVGVESSLSYIGATKVWEEFKATGEGIVVAGQDTGVEYTHPALKKHYRGFQGDEAVFVNDYNWHDSIHQSIGDLASSCGYDSVAPCDDNDHGSHTMGTMVGDDGEDNKIGVAPGAQWIACRNMDRGTGRPSTYLECFEYFLAPYKHGANAMTDGDPSKAPHVMNNSWGCPEFEKCDGSEFVDALKALYAAGVMVVASAGNDGPDCSTIQDQPASVSEYTFGVGSLNHVSGSISSFSSRGPSAYDNKVGPDVTAPGENIRSSVPGGTYAKAGWSGTSMAGPHVVGAIALLWSADPTLIGKIDETADLLRATATPKTSTQKCGGVSGSTIPNNTWGYGVLNIYAAVQKRLGTGTK